MTSEQQESAVEHPPFHRHGSTDVALWGNGGISTFLATGKDTNGAYTQGEAVVMPGGGPHPHLHQREDETWYVVEGNLEFHIGEATLVAGPGDYVRSPRGTVHAFRNVGEHPARLFMTFVPAGLETFFMEVYQPIADPTAPLPPPAADLIERMIKAAPRYGIEMLPTPASGADTKPGPDAPTGAPGLQH